MKNFNLLRKRAQNFSSLILVMLLSISFSAIAQQKVVGGVDADIKDYPWQVALTSSPGGGGFCGGSIIGDSWVLTAAHCVDGDSPSSLFIRVGSSDAFAAGGDSYAVNQIIVHPNYSGNSYDFALVKIDGEFAYDAFVQSIDLVSEVDVAAGVQDEGVMATITGWGTTSSGGSLASTLQVVEAPIVNNSTACGSTTDVNGNSGDYGCSQLDESMICAGDLVNGGEDACQGDSGGPLVVRNAADTKWVLIGATSWGYGCADVDYPGVWSKVSYVLDWIDTNADVNSEYGCMDETACNYDAEALYDDGSCAELDECGDCGGNGPIAGYDCDGNCISGETLVIEMNDSYGDGWNGNVLNINGVEFTFDSGSSASDVLCYDSLDSCILVSCDGGSWQSEVSWTISDNAGNVLLEGGAPFSGGIGACNFPVPGCTDAAASNYNPAATEDDGSCIYPIDCSDLTAVMIEVGGGSWASEVSWELNGFTGGAESSEACLEDGCHTFNMYDSYGDGWNGNTVTITTADAEVILTGTLETGSEGILSLPLNYEGDCGPVYGCTDSLALNFDATATADDGSCLYPTAGCTDSLALNYNPEATEDDGSCQYPVDCEGLTNVVVDMVDSFGDGWNGNVLTVNGQSITLEEGSQGTATACVDLTQECISVTCDGGIWQSEVSWIISSEGTVLLQGGAPYNGGIGDCGIIEDIYGCTDSLASNYNSEATIDDGSCTYPVDCGDLTSVMIEVGGGSWASEVSWELNGFTGSTGSFDACLEDGCHIFNMYDSYGDGWNGNVVTIFAGSDVLLTGTLEQGSEGVLSLPLNYEGDCGPVYGCTDSLALNFDATATADDGSCLYPTAGCTDSLALNYNPEATEDDGSCQYPIDCSELMGATIEVGGGFYDYEISWELNGLTGETGVTETCLEEGCYTFNMYDSYGDGWNNATVTITTADSMVLLTGTLEAGSEGVLFFSYNADCGYTYGCTDSLALNYDSEATFDDGSCMYPTPGCTDSLALNYNPDATEDDGSCQYPVDCEGLSTVVVDMADSFGDGWNGNVLTINGQSLTIEQGSEATSTACVDLTQECVSVTCDGGSWQSEVSWTISSEGTVLLEGGAPYNGGIGDCGIVEDIYGCTDSLASNYNSEATIDDGSCTYTVDCEGLTAVTIEVGGGSWASEVSWALGSFSGVAESVSACLEDGCHTFNMYDSYGDGWNGNTVTITTADGEVILTGTLETGSEGTLGFGLNTEEDCGEIVVEILGCTDETALNYNPEATQDDGSCEYPTECDGLTTVTIEVGGGDYMNEVSWSIAGFTGEVGTSQVCLEDGCHSFTMLDSYGDGWNGNTVTITSSTGDVLLTGTLEEGSEGALGFGVNTSEDCGEVVVEILGCTDATALNYNSEATQDDGSCEYSEGPWDVIITGSNHTMILDGNALFDINGEDISVGDALGVFYTDSNGDLQCAGYAVWNGSTNTIAAQGDDSTTEEIDGFVAGESFVWMVWDASEDVEYMANATYSAVQPSQGEFVVNGISAMVELATAPAVSEQVISMPEGWSTFSTYMLADDMDMAVILSPIYDDVIIAKNNTGAAYLPEWNFNGIGDLEVGQAYQVKLANANSITIEGTYMLPEENPIQLVAGWNMIGYLRLEPAPADAVLEEVNSTGNLVIAKDYNGSAYLPEWDFNGIGDMVPGEGYQLKINNDDVLQYLSNDMSYRLTTAQYIENNLNQVKHVTVTDNNMTVIIEDAAWDVIPNEGAEVAAYDKSGNLIGAAVYSSPVTVVTLWGNDALTNEKDGLDVSEIATLKMYSEGTARDINITEWLEGSSAYSVDAINIAGAISTDVEVIECFGTERVLIKVVNTLGQEVQMNDESFKGEVLFKVFNDGSVEKIVR